MKKTLMAEMRDRKGRIISIRRYHHSLQKQVMRLFREGYPDSFDGNDLREIKKETVGETEKTFLLAFTEGELVGAMTGFFRMSGLHRLYEGGYLFVRHDMRGVGIATMLSGVAEELLKDEARIIMITNAAILPDYEVSYKWFKSVGFERMGRVPYWFRDDLPAIFFGKRNPYFSIGKGIPKNSGWGPELVDSETRERITEQKYEQIMNDPGLVLKEKWGLNLVRNLIGRKNILIWEVKNN
ncbi:GNAT family N-acetyltransferase [Patescibacteria group bacterium]